MQEEYETEEQEHHEGSWLISWGLPIVYVGLVFAFGIQTWELVAHLFPAENLFMQIATVFSFDVMAAIWLGVKTFGRFRLYSSLSLVRWMFRITFTLATIASVIQMYLNAVHFLYQSVDHNIILFAYALVVISFAGNLIALSYLLSSEHDAKTPNKIIGSGYMPKMVKRPPPSSSHQQPVRYAQTASVQQQSVRATHLLASGDEITVYAPTQQIAQQTLKEEVQKFQSSPLPGPQLVPGSHEGNQNNGKQ